MVLHAELDDQPRALALRRPLRPRLPREGGVVVQLPKRRQCLPVVRKLHEAVALAGGKLRRVLCIVTLRHVKSRVQKRGGVITGSRGGGEGRGGGGRARYKVSTNQPGSWQGQEKNELRSERWMLPSVGWLGGRKKLDKTRQRQQLARVRAARLDILLSMMSKGRLVRTIMDMHHSIRVFTRQELSRPCWASCPCPG